jgi:nucleoside-triphosphatase THEP1
MTDLPLITALIYTDSDAADRLLRATALVLMEAGHSLAGLVQHNRPRPGRSRCDMVLEELASGDLVPISQDRGPHARGCALDVHQLLDGMQRVRRAIATQPDLVILNKFGKTESEGGGFRPLIAEVIEAGVPLLIAVPWRNIDSWRLFAGELSRDIAMKEASPDAAALAALLEGRIGATSPQDKHTAAATAALDHGPQVGASLRPFRPCALARRAPSEQKAIRQRKGHRSHEPN